jgi:hypothetical protein
VSIALSNTIGFIAGENNWSMVDQINCIEDLDTLIALYAALKNPDVCSSLLRELQIKKAGGDEVQAMINIAEQIRRNHANTENPDDPANPRFVAHIIQRIDNILSAKEDLLENFPTVIRPLRTEFTAQSYVRMPSAGEMRARLYMNPTWAMLTRVQDFVDRVLSKVGNEGYISDLIIQQVPFRGSVDIARDALSGVKSHQKGGSIIAPAIAAGGGITRVLN